MTNYLAHVAELVINQPLMILPEKLAVIASVLEGRINIDASAFKELVAADEDRPKPQGSRYVGEFAPVDPNDARAGRKPYRTTKEGVAIIPVHGSLVNRGGFLDAMSGITSYEKLKFQADAAGDDKDVGAVLMDYDSGGGEAVGAFEAGDVVHRVAQKKPVYAVANGLMCSAAYAIASGSTRIIASRSSVVGSIGTALLHLDRSKQLSDAGIKPTLFTTGKRKGDGSPFFELSDEVKGELRGYVQRVNANFFQLVVGHRGVTAEALQALEAGVFIGAEAIAHGLVDEVGSFETALSELSRGANRQHTKTSRGLVMTSETTYTQAQLDASVASAITKTTTELTALHNAALTAATEKATGEGRTAGVTAERDRVKAIVALDDAKGRGAAALHLALSTDIGADAAKLVLSGIPKAGADGGNSMGLFLDPSAKTPNPTAGNNGWDDVAAELNKGVKK